MAFGPRGFCLRAAVAAAALLCALGGVAAQDAPPADTSALTILSRGPNAEFRIRGVSLKSVRADDAQNTVAFDFNGPVSDEAFARLQDELPDWIEMAYAGYDNAVIRAKRPVTFMTRAESDGFSLRMVPRDGAPAVALRGADDAGAPPAPPAYTSSHDWHQVQTTFARATAERPFDTLIRASYDALRDGGASYVTIDSDWRHNHGNTVIASNAHADIETGLGFDLLGDVHDVVVNAKAVRLPGGSIGAYNRNDLSGAVGVGIPLGDATATAELLYGRSGLGGRVGLSEVLTDWQYDIRTAYHEPYTDTAEAVAARADRDYTSLYVAGELFDGLWGTAEARGTRYGIHGDAVVANTAGFHAGLRYDLDGWPLSLTYDADGEYVIAAHHFSGVAPTPYVPLSIRDREVHQFGGAFSDKLDNAFWFDLYGGYAIDRYSNDGPYGGLALRFTPGPGLDIALSGRYSTVADREGERGDELTGGVTLTYAFGGDAPILHAGPGTL